MFQPSVLVYICMFSQLCDVIVNDLNYETGLIFTARRSYANVVLGIVILSVRPSVTRMLCD